MSVYYLQGQSTSGNTDGLFGYFYPLYTDESLINGRYHSHTFEGLNEVFYMPTGEMNHAAELPPADTSYGGLIYQKYATYNVSNTVISYTNISTEQTQTVIPIASNARDFDPFDTNVLNTESLRVEELIPEQLRESSESFISLIKDYYNHLNTEGLPTYEANRIVDEHDIDKVSAKYLDGIQGEIAKNIPDSAVMDRVSLYKKIIQYYTLKGSEESITTFFRLFFDEIVKVSYPRERLFELSSGDWKKENGDFTRSFTVSVDSQDLGAQYNWTPFQLKNSNDVVIGNGNIIRAEEVSLYNTAPPIQSLLIDLDSKKNLNSINETWDSVVLSKPFRGYFYQGAEFNQVENRIQLDGKRSYIDFGDIGDNSDIPLDSDEHSFIIRTLPRDSKENSEIQPLFSLSKDYESFHSHELFFNKTTGKIGRSFIDTGEPRIFQEAGSNNLEFSNFIDQSTIGLDALSGDKLDHMNSFLSPLGKNYNGTWIDSSISFNNNPVYIHETDPVRNTFTADDLIYYAFDGDTFSGPNNLQIGQSIYGEDPEDFSGVNAISEDGFTLAVGAAKNDGGGNNSGSVRVYALANAILHRQALHAGMTRLELKNVPEDITTIPAGTVITGLGLPELGASDQFISTSSASRLIGQVHEFNIYGALTSATLTLGQPLRIGTGVNTWLQLGSDIDGDDTNDLLGSDLSLSADGSILAVGAPQNKDSVDENNIIGEVKIYEWNTSGWNLKKSITTDVENSKLGSSVSLNGAGDRLAIGSGSSISQNYDIGTEEDGSGILLEDFNGFGTTHVAQDILIDDQVIGFDYDGKSFTETGTYNGKPDYSGFDADLGIYYNIQYNRETGPSGWSAVTFNSDNDDRVSTTQIHTDNTDFPWLYTGGNRSAQFTQFLVGLSFASDGTTATVITDGTFDTTSTHIVVSGVSHQYDGLFEIASINSTTITYLRSGPTLTTNSFSLETGITPQFGAIDGGKTIGFRIPLRSKNEVVIYEYANSQWQKVGDNIEEENSDPLSGNTVRLSDDGRTVLVGTYIINNSGNRSMSLKAYYNEVDTDVWVQTGSETTFIASEASAQVPISLSNDGTTFAVGILGDGTQADYKGNVEIYSLSNGIWTKRGQTIEGENVGDACGASVSLNSAGNIIAIGSPNNNTAGIGSGQVRSFSYTNGSWMQVGANIEGFGTTSNAGKNISINGTGTRIVVGCPGNDDIGTNRGKVEVYQIAIDATIGTFIHAEKHPLNSGESRWSIKSRDKTVYYTDWYLTSDLNSDRKPHSIKVKWNKGSRQGNDSLPTLPHCDTVKHNNNHIFTLHNRGNLSIFYKLNEDYIPWQEITIANTETYDGERLWDILDYAVNGDYLVLLDRPINGESRLVIFSIDEYNNYNFYQAVSLNLPFTHKGSADFAHLKFSNNQIVVGTHTFNNVNIAQVIQVYTAAASGLWSSTEFVSLPPTSSRSPIPALEFDINKNFNNGSTWISTNNNSRFELSETFNNISGDSGVILKSPISTRGTGLDFKVNSSFSLSLRFKTNRTYAESNDILTIGNITLRIANNPLTGAKTLQIVSKESGKIDYPTFLDKIDTNIILDNIPNEIFSDEYFNSDIDPAIWNNLVIEFTTGSLSINSEKVITGLRYSLNGFKRSKSIDLILTDNNPDGERSPIPGITASSQIKLYNGTAFSHIAFYNKELDYLEFEEIEKKLSSEYSNTITTGINSLLDGGKFDLSETGNIIAKVTSYGIHIWEKLEDATWENYYNRIVTVTGARSSYITHNGSRTYSFKFFGNDLLLVSGGLNNAKQFVDQYNYSNVYNKEQHNSASILYYIKSQYTTSNSTWRTFKELGPSKTFVQRNQDDFKIGLNFGVDIAVDNANNSFAISLEPDSVNKILNGPNSSENATENSTNVVYDVYRKLSSTVIQSFPIIEPTEGFPAVSSYSGRLDNSAVVKIAKNAPSYNAAFSFPDIILTSLPEKPIIEYTYDKVLDELGFFKSNNEYTSDFVISTAPSAEVYLDTETVVTTAFGLISVRGKADRYNGYVDISYNGSNFERIIEGNTIRHLSISPQANFVLGRNATGNYNGDITHAQYYSRAISDSIADQLLDYFDKNVKTFYKLIFDKIEGSAIGATQLTSVPNAKRNFLFKDLNGHTFNSFLYFDDPLLKYEEGESNTAVRLKVDYGINAAEDAQVYWGDGRLNNLHNVLPVIHEYTLEYVGEYFDKKGRLSGQMRIQDSDFWQKFSYNIRSGIKVDDWESTFLSLVHPAGLKFFASVILLVIRDNHWLGPKYIEYDPATRKNVNLLRVEDKYLAPFRTTQPLEDMRWLEDLTAPNASGGYHMPMFQPGWLQGDIRTREFIFEAGLWTKLARSVPGNNLASRYSVSYSEGDPSEDFEIRVQAVTGTPLRVADSVTQGTNQGTIIQLRPDGNEFTGIIKRSGDESNVFTDGDITVTSTGATATILAIQLRNQETTISVYGAEEQNQAYLLQDTSSIDINSELFMRSVLMAFKYVIPALVPQKVFTKRDYEQNLKFKDTDDISSYLPITIKDALDNRDIFMNVGAMMNKINQLDTESGLGFVLESDTADTDRELHIDDHATNWWNDAANDADLSAPFEFIATSIGSTGDIVQGDIVFQDIQNDEDENLTITGSVVGHNSDGSNRTILISWKGAINTDSSTTLPSTPEADQFFRTGVIYTIGNAKQANIVINT